MKLPTRSVACFLGAIAFLSVLLRYPTTEHEIGVDSFFIHNLATIITTQGQARWLMDPLSLFGLYPMSYPSADPFLLAAFAQMVGVSVETAILFISLALGVFGVFVSFVMAREFYNDNLFGVSVAFLYALAPRFLDFTLWTSSSRGLFMLLLPGFVWSIIRVMRDPKPKNVGMLTAILFLLGVTHHLTALLLAVLGAGIASVALLTILRVLRLNLPRATLAQPFRKVSPYVALGAFATVASAVVASAGVLPQYAQGELASGSSLGVELFNLGVSLMRSVGLSLILSVPGLVILVHRKNKGFSESLVLLSFLGLTPTLFLRAYTGFYILPFVTLLAGLAVVRLAAVQRRRIRVILLAAAFSTAGILSAGILRYEVAHSPIMSLDTYSAAVYVRGMTPGQVVLSNDGLRGVQVASTAGCAYLPVGGASTLFQSPELLAYRFFGPGEVIASLSRVSLGDISLDSDSPFFSSSIQAERDWVSIMQSSYGAQIDLMTRYHPTLYLETGTRNASFFAYGSTYDSTFARTMYLNAYKIYDDGSQSIWSIGAVRP